MRKTVHYKISGLSYVFLKDAPVVHTRFGDALAVDLSLVERKIAREIVKQGVPLRGAEVQFLRKCLGFSMEKFATRLGLSAPAILKWERARKKRLEPVNEVGVDVSIDKVDYIVKIIRILEQTFFIILLIPFL